jgi:hypothetical protein
VVFDSSVDVNGAEWKGAIKTAIKTSTKYVVLDLSACSASAINTQSPETAANTIEGYFDLEYADYTGIYFNTIADGNGASYIVGIIFPDCITTIGLDTGLGFTALRSVTIPASVTELVAYSLKEAPNLTSITIENTVKMTVHKNAVSQAFKTCYDAGPNYAGVYTLSDGSWMRAD